MVERGGRVRLRVIASRRGEPLSREVRAQRQPGRRSSSPTTGRPTSRCGASTQTTASSTIRPASYVEGDIHTNTIEGFFGNLKTGMRGTYKHVSQQVASVLPRRVRLALQPTLLAVNGRCSTPCSTGRRDNERADGASCEHSRRRQTPRESRRGASEKRPTSYGATASEAQKAGISITQIASEAGLSRQGVYDLLAERP